MSIPTLTLRSVRNKDTGIDISSPTVQEVEAPLGGTSIEYEILVVTRLPLFKTQLHKSEDVVHFSVYKAYREVEDLHGKLQKKYSLRDLPSIPKQRQILSTSTEEKKVAIDELMTYIAKSDTLSSSSIFIQFLGISPQKQRSLSNAGPVEDVLNTDDKSAPNESETLNENVQQNENREKSRALSEVLWPVEKEKPPLSIIGNIDLFTSPEQVTPENTANENEVEHTESIDDLFLKVKDYKQKSQQTVKSSSVSNETKTAMLPSESYNAGDEDIDLFEEVQRSKENQKLETELFDTKRKAHHGLFDGIDDGSSALFGINVLSKESDVITPQSSSSDSDTKSEVSIEKSPGIEILPNLGNATEKHSTKFADNSSNASVVREQRQLGEVSLFQEQDLGDSITVDEEPFFLVSQTKGKGVRKNPLLSPKMDDFESSELTQGSENLDELLNLAPLPAGPQPAKQTLFPETLEDQILDLTMKSKLDSSNTELQKPGALTESLFSEKHKVLKPEVQVKKQSATPEVARQSRDARSEPLELGRAEQLLTSELKHAKPKEVLPERPVPMPRNKAPPPKPKEKPQVLPRRASLGKPSLPPKPVPAPKPKPAGIAQKPSSEKNLDSVDNKSDSTKVQRKTNNAPGDLNSLDILQYIAQEEKSSLTEASLFD